VRALHFALATGVLCGAIAGLINVLTIMAVGVLGLTYRVPKVTPRGRYRGTPWVRPTCGEHLHGLDS